MLIDRHRTAALIQLSEVATAPAEVRTAKKEALEALIVALFQAATPEARATFLARVALVPAEARPWAYVRPSQDGLAIGPQVPPALALLLGQHDDDPDSSEDGNRLPYRTATEGASWLPLYSAFDRWDTATISQYIGPVGWMLPPESLKITRDAQAVEFVPDPQPSPVITRSEAAPPAAEKAATPGPVGPSPGPVNSGASTMIVLGLVAGVTLGGPTLYYAFKR
ncbi:hypothetical protein [Nannocystis pusilla]|uniref:Uncharacterized protein n=1 Tax=Nannocystis pusilla TaxID=889268 RepID=A0ABS7TN73_9BACT|nr:hypothetical protein [Nannocystis pusilla]MBZ5709655.1 hypothetical protein [Nannocystis pusilla]